MSDRLLDLYEDQEREEALSHEAWEASQHENPFPLPPRPSPCVLDEDDDFYNAWNLLSPESIADTFSGNHDWLQSTPRTSMQVLAVLFPSYKAAGMTRDEMRQSISRALFDAGYTPNNLGPNPSWSWMEGN